MLTIEVTGPRRVIHRFELANWSIRQDVSWCILGGAHASDTVMSYHAAKRRSPTKVSIQAPYSEDRRIDHDKLVRKLRALIDRHVEIDGYELELKFFGH